MLKIVGNFCLDTAKLVIGGVIIGAIMRHDVDLSMLLLHGIVATTLLLTGGFVAHFYDRKLNKQ